jgi:hypothetical protein
MKRSDELLPPNQSDEEEETDYQSRLPDDDASLGIRPPPLRGGLALFAWILFRGATLATFLRTIAPKLHINLAIWKIDPVSPTDSRIGLLRRARWRAYFVLPFFLLLLCYLAIWLLRLNFDWTRSWLFARYAFGMALFVVSAQRSRVAVRASSMKRPRSALGHVPQSDRRAQGTDPHL